jgi:hypothetical protein
MQHRHRQEVGPQLAQQVGVAVAELVDRVLEDRDRRGRLAGEEQRLRERQRDPRAGGSRGLQRERVAQMLAGGLEVDEALGEPESQQDGRARRRAAAR